LRLLTRFDFDGVCCAVLLKALGIIDSMEFVHPKELQDGNVEVTSDDVLANVAYKEGCGLWFDHHSSEQERLDLEGQFEGASRLELSTARVIYNYYDGSNRLTKFSEMVDNCDIADSARFGINEVLHPQGWMLLAFMCDPRTGLAYYNDYRISHYDFMHQLVDKLLEPDIDKILTDPDLKERAKRYYEQDDVFKKYLVDNSREDGPVVITDSRNNDANPPGNRFLIYSLFPNTNISIRLMDGREKKNVVISVGHSILNRTSEVNVGSIMLRYGGGGHFKVGTCQVPAEAADKVLNDLVSEIKNS